jgi:phosphatidate cytidylyltransferase
MINKKRLSDLKRRLIVSILFVCIAALLIAFSSLFFVSVILAFVVAFIVAVAVWEYGQLAILKDLNPAIWLMIAVAVCEVFSFFIALKIPTLSFLPFIVVGVGLIAFFLNHFRDAAKALLHLAVEFFSIFYIAIPLSFLLGILYPAPHHFVAQDGRWWLVYLIVVTKVTDIGGYFVGRLWGKNPLAPSLSPKKTREGACAGFFCSLIVSVLFSYLGSRFAIGAFDLSFVEALWLGALLSIVGQIGDLSESLLKRDAVVKDSNILPGLGGILDMVDSLLFTTPMLYFFLRTH